jgi:hypothetical protein
MHIMVTVINMDNVVEESHLDNFELLSLLAHAILGKSVIISEGG